MKKWVLILTLFGASAFADASVYFCKANHAPIPSYLLVFDRIEQSVAVFSRAASADSWSLQYGTVHLTLARQAHPEFYGMAEDYSSVDWEWDRYPDKCHVSKKPTLSISFPKIDGDSIRGKMEWMSNIVRNPHKSDCPLPPVLPSRTEELTCDKI